MVDFYSQSLIWKKLPSLLMNDFYRTEWPSGAKNAVWLERSQALRSGLNAFWAEMKAAVADTLISSLELSPAVVEATLKAITASSSPGYCRAIEAETNKILADIAKTSSTSCTEASQNWNFGAPANIPSRPAESLKRYVLQRSRVDCTSLAQRAITCSLFSDSKKKDLVLLALKSRPIRITTLI